jgi:hypothetical protein
MKDSTKSALIVGGVVAGIGLLAYAATAKASPAATPTPPALPAPPALPPGFNVVNGTFYTLQMQVLVPATQAQIAKDIGFAQWQPDTTSFSPPDGSPFFTIRAQWLGPSGQAKSQISPNLKIINMTLAPSPSRNIVITPASSGTIAAKVGDVISITGMLPFNPNTNANGFSVFAAPTIVKQISPSDFGIIAPGTIHIAFPGGEAFVQANA